MITRNYVVQVPQHERVTLDGGGFTTRALASKYVDIELTIDDAMLASYLGIRAAKSKRGVSAYLGGLVKARLTRSPKEAQL